MNAYTRILGLGAVVVFTLTWLLIVLFFFSSGDQAGSAAIRRYRSYIEQKLRFLRWRYPAARIFWAQLCLAVLSLGHALASGSWLPLIVLPLILFGPKLQLDRLAAQRVASVEAQIESWLNAIANALKASPSLGEAISSSVALLPAPMSEEIDLMVKEYELGMALDRALEQFAQRLNSRTLSGAVLALQVARNSGGNLPETLENAAAALREMARLEGVVRTKTAEGKAQSFVIGAIPVPMVLGINYMDQHFFDPLLVSFTGHLVIGAAVVCWISAILLTMKILAVDI